MNFIQPGVNNTDAANDYYNKYFEFDTFIEEQLNERELTNTNNNMSGGYVNLDNSQNNNNSFNLFNETNSTNTNYSNEATMNIHSDSPLARVYFSKENIDLIQDMIRYKVYERSNQQHIIGRQSDTELQIIMRHFYLTYGKNQPDNLTSQVAELNTYVVDECVPMILSSVEQYLSYRVRITQNPVPLENPQNMSDSKHNQLQPNHWI